MRTRPLQSYACPGAFAIMVSLAVVSASPASGDSPQAQPASELLEQFAAIRKSWRDGNKDSARNSGTTDSLRTPLLEPFQAAPWHPCGPSSRPATT